MTDYAKDLLFMVSDRGPSSNLSSVSVALLVGATVLVVTIAALSLLTNNVVLVSVTGIIVGATFTIIGNILNVAWLEPLRKKQEREERTWEQNRERLNKRMELRRALYNEIMSLFTTIFAKVGYHRTMCHLDKECGAPPEYLQSADKGKGIKLPPQRVYDKLAEDPLVFGQLEEASVYDVVYERIRQIERKLDAFESTVATESEIRAECEKLIRICKDTLEFTDKAFTDGKVVDYLDGTPDEPDEGFVTGWNDVKKLLEAELEIEKPRKD